MQIIYCLIQTWRHLQDVFNKNNYLYEKDI